jgi:archaeosine-15-forming tRNA-guanine transglycosylase
VREADQWIGTDAELRAGQDSIVVNDDDRAWRMLRNCV